MAAVTLTELKAELQLQGDAEDAYLTILLDGVENWLESEWGILLSAQDVSEGLIGDGRNLWPTKVPVNSVSSVALEGSTVSSGDYTLRGKAIVNDDAWEEDFYDVTYNAGYSTVPDRVKSLILTLIRRRYDSRGGAESERAGGHTVQWRKLVETDTWQMLRDLAGGPPC